MEELKDFPPDKSLALSELPVRVRKVCETVRLCGRASGSSVQDTGVTNHVGWLSPVRSRKVACLLAWTTNKCIIVIL